MFLQTRATKIGRNALNLTAAAAAMLVSATTVGCGAGVSNLLPVVPPSANENIPSGPVLGYIFSSTDGTLRAMLGVRGAARVSASIVPAGVYVAGEASTASGSGLLEDENGGLFAFQLPGSQPAHVADGLPANLRIAFAPSGQTAVAYAPGSQGLTLITGLPATPAVQRINVSGSGRLLSAAVSDAGTIVISSQGSSIAVGTVSLAGQFSRLAAASAAPSFSFLAGSEDMLLADAGANTVNLIHTVSTTPAVQPLSVPGLNRPVAISASHDKHWAAIANGSDANLLRVDLTASTAVTKLACACQPSLLSSLAGNATFRVNTLESGPIWTFDLNGSTPQLLFVPAISQATP